MVSFWTTDAIFSLHFPVQQGNSRLSDDVLGGQDTGLLGVGELDLDCRVVDAEAMVKLLRDAVEQRIAGVTVRHHQMAGQRRLRRAHAPDVQIMQSSDAGSAQQMCAHGLSIDAFRYCVQGEADGTLYQAPSADD